MAEQAVAAQFRQVIEHSSDYVAIVDVSGTVIYLNAAARALMGYGADESPPASFFLPQWALDTLGNPPNENFTNGVWQGEATIQLMEGIEIPVEQKIITHLDANGHVAEISTLCRDQLEQRFVEESQVRLMVQSEKLKALQEMIAHFTHDLKAPLTAIVTSLYLAERQANDASRRQERFSTIRDQTRLLETMIQDILTYSRFEVIPELNRQAFNLVDLLNQIQQNLKPEIERKNITFLLEVPPAGCPISADMDGLMRMFSNLIENAVKYTRADGNVFVGLKAADGMATVTIADSGIGIDEAEVPRIFEQFFRASSAKDAEISGTGVGLAIVKRIIDLHDGIISVKSGLGQGTTFVVRLPLG